MAAPMTRPEYIVLVAGRSVPGFGLGTGDGYAVLVAEDGGAVLDLAQRQLVDLVLLHLDMSADSAENVVARLRRDPLTAAIPIIVLTPPAEIDRAVTCLGLGADDYVLDPVNPKLLLVRLANFRAKQHLHRQVASQGHSLERLERLFDHLAKSVIPIGAALLEERDLNQMLERILMAAKSLSNADGGTLYMRSEDNQLRFAMVHNDSLGLAMGGASGTEVPFEPLLLYQSDGSPNQRNVATYAALTGCCVNVEDAYEADGFDFSGTRSFDAQTGYRSMSFLTVPLKNFHQRVIGVLQLLNAKDPASGRIVSFDPEVQRVVESLSLLAAAALEAHLREAGLRRQIAEMQIHIDEGKKAEQIAEITDTDYFRELQRKAKRIRGQS